MRTGNYGSSSREALRFSAGASFGLISQFSVLCTVLRKVFKVEKEDLSVCYEFLQDSKAPTDKLLSLSAAQKRQLEEFRNLKNQLDNLDEKNFATLSPFFNNHTKKKNFCEKSIKLVGEMKEVPREVRYYLLHYAAHSSTVLYMIPGIESSSPGSQKVLQAAAEEYKPGGGMEMTDFSKAKTMTSS